MCVIDGTFTPVLYAVQYTTDREHCSKQVGPLDLFARLHYWYSSRFPWRPEKIILASLVFSLQVPVCWSSREGEVPLV